MNKPKTGTIYALDDPRDGSTRYIGKTTQDPLDRLAGHLATATNPAMRVWINALGAQGLLPHMRSLKTIAVDKLDGEEMRQIARHARAGHRLLNAPHYHQNLRDLFSPSALPVEEPGDEDPRRNSVERIARCVYGPTAANWAAGRLSIPQASARVLLLAPIAALAILVRMLIRVRWTRRIFLAGAAAFYLWTIGFSRVAQDFVLPHLPVAAVVRFWRDYLSQPVLTLGGHFLFGVLLVAIWWCSPVVEAARSARPKPTAHREGALPASGSLDAVDVAAAAAAALDGALLKERPPRRL